MAVALTGLACGGPRQLTGVTVATGLAGMTVAAGLAGLAGLAWPVTEAPKLGVLAHMTGLGSVTFPATAVANHVWVRGPNQWVAAANEPSQHIMKVVKQVGESYSTLPKVSDPLVESLEALLSKLQETPPTVHFHQLPAVAQ